MGESYKQEIVGFRIILEQFMDREFYKHMFSNKTRVNTPGAELGIVFSFSTSISTSIKSFTWMTAPQDHVLNERLSAHHKKAKVTSCPRQDHSQ